MLVTTDGGASWSWRFEHSPTGFLDITCPSATECIATGTHKDTYRFVTTVDGGQSWSALNVDGELSQVSCASTAACWAVGLNHFWTTTPTVMSVSPTAGPAGTPVTINGRSLGGATSVDFDDTPATITSDTQSQIVTSVPAGAASGPITVTTPAGTASTSEPFSVT